MTDLPDDLKEKVDRALAQYTRCLLTADEFAGRLTELAAEQANKSTEGDTTFFGLMIARTYDVPLAFLGLMVDWCDQVPSDLQAKLDEALVAESRKPWDEFECEAAQVAAQFAAYGPVPPPVRAAVRQAPGGSWSSWVELRESAREGGWSRVDDLVRDAAERGCVSYALVAVDLFRAWGEPEESAVRRGVAMLDPAHLRARASWGGLALVAARLAAAGLDTEAGRWSDVVEDGRLYHHDPDVWSRTEWPPRHGDGCLPGCYADDASLLGALSFIDVLTGREDRALVRARSCDRGSDGQGWSSVADVFLARWVESRSLPADERAGLLAGLSAKHTWLGLLQAQISTDLADLAQRRGDVDLARALRVDATEALERPVVRLFSPVGFAFQGLLTRLPVLESRAEDTNPDLQA